jgi:hypothetical protein
LCVPRSARWTSDEVQANRNALIDNRMVEDAVDDWGIQVTR